MRRYLPSLRKHGILNVVLHLPVLIATSFWGLMLVGIFDLDTLNDPFWMPISFLPMYIPPISCVVGIVRGIMYLKRARDAKRCVRFTGIVHRTSDRDAKLCVILSVIGVFLYAG